MTNTRTQWLFWLALILLAGQSRSHAQVLQEIAQPGYNVQITTSPSEGTDPFGAPLTVPAAIAYSPNGTLYSVSGPNYTGSSVFVSSTNTIDILTATSANPAWGTPITLQNGATFAGASGAAWDFTTGQLLVADDNFNTGNGYIYSINVAPGANQGVVSTLATIAGDSTLSQIAVQPGTGNVFVSDAPFSPATPTIYEINRGTGNSVSQVLTGSSDGISGMGFDALGKLTYQDVTFNFSGGVSTANVLQQGNSTPLATSVASFDLAVTTDSKAFVTGSVMGPIDAATGQQAYYYGLFEPGQTSTPFDSILTYKTFNASDNGESLAYLPGSAAFQPYAGAAGGQMAFVLSDTTGTSLSGAGTYIYLVTPTPEPSSWALLAIGAGGMLAARRWRRTLCGR